MSMKVVVKWDGDLVSKKVLLFLERAISEECENLLNVTNSDVPFMDGNLQMSGDYDIEVKKGDVKGSVYYDTAYAVRLHEHPEYHFNNGRKGKYLEDNLLKQQESIQQNIKKTLERALSILGI